SSAKPVLDKTGYKKGDSTIGVLSLKELLLLAKKIGINKYGMDKNIWFGDGTLNAVNYLLGQWGYKQNGIAGQNFIKRLHTELEKKM
ncbi:MAG: glycoside hydrolase, partial [Ruminococcus sp.]|nr:glycoside hydrolase [Ruminococcus sp.]